MTEHPQSPITTDSAEAALDAGLAAAFAPDGTGDYQSRAAGFIPAEVAGTVIAGKYKLLERIGEGGMGSVWMAQQTEPVKRYVAIKLIKTGMDSKQVLARFEAERQALAVMDHPNIAKILDGGITPPTPPSQGGERVVSPPWEAGAGGVVSGRPYFVMELVKGVPITKYCDEHKLTPRQRLELFVPVCQAIQHAHQKGIIHRDIKPSNVMVALYDDKPVPKVIDFGVAKATGQSLTGQTLNTGFGGIVGTPQYMSPEQASLNNLDIDTRSDIYSLGVLLYELLTGSPPFAQKDLEKAGVLEMLRVIREEEPPRPSTKLSTADALPSLSANRSTDPKKLTGILRNELDWIVMKALEKDCARRYETANGFAADINRYLAGEPVNAHPPSAAYRMKKFLRKHKGPVIAASAVAAALLVGIVGFGWQARIAQHERDAAQTECDRAVVAEGETKKRADELKLVSDFQAQMLGQVDPTQAGRLLGDDVRAKLETALAKANVAEPERAAQIAAFTTHWQRVNATDVARELIDRTILKPAVAAINKQFSDQPLVDAKLCQVLVDRYVSIGLLDAARPLQERALSIRRQVLGSQHVDTLTSMYFMGELHHLQGRHSEAESLHRESLMIRRQLLGEDHVETLRSMVCLGAVLQYQGKLKEAEPFVREGAEKYRHVLGEAHKDTAKAISMLGRLRHVQGQPKETEKYWRETLAIRRQVLGPDHRETVTSISNLAAVLQVLGRSPEAELLFREALEKNRQMLGEYNPHTITSINNVGFILADQNKLQESESYVREALEKNRLILGEDHPDTLSSMNNMGSLLKTQGKLNEAERYLTQALAIRRRVLGEEHANTLTSIDNLSNLRFRQGKLDESEQLLREALEKRRRILGEDHPSTLKSIGDMGVLLQAQRKPDAAEPFCRESVEKHRRSLGNEHPNTINAISNLCAVLEDQGHHSEVVALLVPAEPTARAAFTGNNAGRLASLLVTLGKARIGLREYPGAESVLLEANGILTRTRAPVQKNVRDCIRALHDLYTAWHAAEPGKGYDVKAAELTGKLEAMKADMKP